MTHPPTILRRAALLVVALGWTAVAIVAAPWWSAGAGAAALLAGGGPLDLRYVIYWGGIHVADAALRYDEEAAGTDGGGPGYRSELTTRTRGLVDLVVRYRGQAATEGERSGDDGDGQDRLAPVTYRADYTRRDSTRSTAVSFDPASGDVVGVEMRKRGKPKRSEVPPELRLGVVDPLTALFSLRERTAAALNGDGPRRFTVGVFDGSRRYDIAAELLGRRTATLDGRKRPVVEVKLAFTPLAGFDVNDYTEDPREDGGDILVQLSDDGRLVPLHLKAEGGPATTVIRLVRDCSGGRCGGEAARSVPTN